MNLNTISRSFTSRLLAAVAALVAVTVVFSPAASADPVSVTYDQLGAGYNDVYNSQDAGAYVFNIGGQEVLAYCADVDLAFNGSANFTAVPADTSGIPGIDVAGWIVANSSTIGTPDADANTEAAAVQVAVWSHTNNITIDSTTVPYDPVRIRAVELINETNGRGVTSAPATFALSLTGTADGNVARFTATLATDSGDPIAGEDIVFSTAGGDTATATTDADGTASWEVAVAEATSVDAEAAWSGVLAAGTVIVPDDGSQPLVLAENVAVSRTANAVAHVSSPAPVPADTPAAPAPAPQPDPAASAAPVEQLPYTGGNLGVAHLVGGLVALAAAGFIILRMRRNVAV